MTALDPPCLGFGIVCREETTLSMVNKVLSGMLGYFSSDLAVDMGTANTCIMLPSRGVVCCEPSVVAVRYTPSGRRHLVAVGTEAQRMIGRTPSDMRAIRPLRGGGIADFELAEILLAQLLRMVMGNHPVVNPRLVLCIPCNTTDVERRALREAAEAAGARGVHLLESPVAAAMGADLPITRPTGSMVVDIGAGSTDVAVISMAEVVYSRTLAAAGDAMDEAVINWVTGHHGVLLGPHSAELVKRELGTAVADDMEASLEVRGRDIQSGFPRAVRLQRAEIAEALDKPILEIEAAMLSALDRTPPELAGDILDRGIVLTGGGARLRGLDKRLRRVTGLPVITAQDPRAAAARGAGSALAENSLLQALCA